MGACRRGPATPAATSPILDTAGCSAATRCSRPAADGCSRARRGRSLPRPPPPPPGPPRGPLAYFGHGWLFCGDTLFSAGCGRLFEGTAAQMLTSLTRLAALPGDTQGYCAHEYTPAHLRFAPAVEPDNADI